MKNLAQETPFDALSGRTLFTTTFVSDSDIIGKRILNIGCGFGWFENFSLQKNVKEIIGIEKKESALLTGKTHLKNSKIKFEVGSAIDLPFPPESFDTVVAWEVIEHIPKGTESRMFSEIQRVLRSDGACYISTPNDSLASKLLDPAWWLIGHRHYSPETLVGLAEKKGLQAKKVVPRGGWWELINMLNLYVAKWIFHRRPFFQSFFFRKLNDEYSKKDGFSNIFIKFVKIDGK